MTQINKTGNLREVQLLLGHTKMDSNVRYLDVELEDALAIAEAIEIYKNGPSLRTALNCPSPTVSDATARPVKTAVRHTRRKPLPQTPLTFRCRLYWSTNMSERT